MLKIIISYALFREYFEDQNILGSQSFECFSKICAKGSKQILPTISLEKLISQELQIKNFAEAFASASFKQNYPHILFIQPTFFDVRMDNIILQDNSMLKIQEDEAHDLIQSLNQHFAEDHLAIEYYSPDIWILGAKQPFEITTSPLSEVIQRPIGAFMPKGQKQKEWGKFLNEVQMLFFSHDVNQQRELQYQLPINSVWIWGDCSEIASRPENQSVTFFSNDEFYQTLFKSHNQQEIIDFNSFLKIQEKSKVYIYNSLKNPALYQDGESYYQHLLFLEKNILQPILNDFKQFKQLEIYCLGEHKTLKINYDQWSNFKFWQLGSSLYQLLK